MASDFEKDSLNKKTEENANFLDMPENEGKSMPPVDNFGSGAGLGVGLGFGGRNNTGIGLEAFQEGGKEIEDGESEQSTLNRLNEILNYWNVPEEEVIELMGQLSRTEANTMFTSSSYKSRVATALTNAEMFQAMSRVNATLFRKLTWCFYEGTSLTYALNLIHAASASEKRAVASSTTMMNNFVRLCNNSTIVQIANTLDLNPVQRRTWLEAEGVTFFEIENSDRFKRSLGDVELNSSLYSRAVRMSEYLINNNLVSGNIIFNDGVRSKTDAHRFSTAYYIRQGQVTTSALQALPEGRDSDGNLWYREGWSRDQIVANATQIWDGARANEGYAIGDPHRAPNADAAPVSTHTQGEAMDIIVRWSSGDEWSEQANSIISYFGLERTEADESWHFELKQ